jgi:23S rRNA (uracil1939-C5)-methyltransferase
MPDEPSLVIGLPRWIPPRRGAASPNPAEPIDVTVERIGAAGDGIARWQGHPVYLPFTLPGDRVRARLGARRGDGYEGHVVDLIAAAPGRITPPCRHFGACGGCALQHLDPEAYRRTKLDNLYAALARIHVDTGAVAPLQIVAPARRRARLGLRRPGDGEVRVGFRSRFRHALIDIEECPVLEPALLVAIGGLRAAGKDFLQPGEMAEASLTRTDSGVDLLLEGAAPPGLAALEALADVAAANDLARIVWRCRGEDTLVVERRPVRVLLSGHAVPFPPGGFLQANAAAERLLVAEVLAGAGA